MSAFANTFLTNAAVLLACMLALWAIGTLRRDVSLVDIFWGTGFAIVAWISWGLTRNAEPRLLLLVVLTTVWGGRLALYLLRRNWGHAEDRRYAAMRAWHGPRFPLISLFTVFLLQGVILWFISLPLQVTTVLNSSRPLGGWDLLGVAIWVIGIMFESVGDWQLARFKANPNNQGRVLDQGLWKFTRHPNYFGDFCIWWGLYVIAAAGGAWWTIGSPLVMSVLLMRVSGVTLLEQTITDRRPDYASYQARTSSFFPWPPRPLAKPANEGR